MKRLNILLTPLYLLHLLAIGCYHPLRPTAPNGISIMRTIALTLMLAITANGQSLPDAPQPLTGGTNAVTAAGAAAAAPVPAHPLLSPVRRHPGRVVAIAAAAIITGLVIHALTRPHQPPAVKACACPLIVPRQ